MSVAKTGVAVNGRVVVSVLGFLLALALALTLLFLSKLTGAEFVAFTLAFAVLAIAVSYSAEIQELSIAGNVVKLKEVRTSAVLAVESLKSSRVELFRILIAMGVGKVWPIWDNYNDVDNRHFWHVVSMIERDGCLLDLKQDLIENSGVLMRQDLGFFCYQAGFLVEEVGLTIESPYVDIVEKFLEAEALRKAGEKLRDDVAIYRGRLEAYHRLYNFRQSLKAM